MDYAVVSCAGGTGYDFRQIAHNIVARICTLQVALRGIALSVVVVTANQLDLPCPTDAIFRSWIWTTANWAVSVALLK